MSKELSKLKVDVLGKVLKKHVTQLRSGNQNEQEFILTNCKQKFLHSLAVTLNAQWTAKVLAAVSLKA